MAKMNHKEIMLKCTQVNCDYMRLPAGMVEGYRKLTELYQRIADQARECAQAWLKDKPCPAHEPAVDAFWWAVVAWSDAFGLSVGINPVEWGKVFIAPHHEFAAYLRPGKPPEPLQPVDGTPAETILELDARWTELVIKLTARWGIMHHLKDRGAMIEARHLQGELRRPGSPAYKAYLRSDLDFFKTLFRNFPFSDKTQRHLNVWLQTVEEALCDIWMMEVTTYGRS